MHDASVLLPLPVVTPIVHGNGDRKETLLSTLKTAFVATRAAIEALRQCAPNGRNFYPEPGRMDRAIAQHDARMRHLGTVLDSLEAEAIQIDRESRTRAGRHV